MDNIRADGNLTSNNNSEMDEIHNCIDDKVWVNETVISGGFTNEKPCNTEYKQGNIHNYVRIKEENIDHLTILVPGSERVTDYIEDKKCLNETVISGADIKQEPCSIKDEQGSIHNYLNIKDENIDNLTVLVPGSELVTDYIEDKVCLNETVISGGSIKQEPCDMKDEQGSIQNYLNVKDENIDDLLVVMQKTKAMTNCIENKVCVCETKISGVYIKDEPCNMGDESGSIHNNVDMKGENIDDIYNVYNRTNQTLDESKTCEECGEEYDLYCLKCPMLIRIFDSNNPDGTENTVRWTLPKNFLDICETPSGMGIVVLRIIPRGVIFGPFKGLDSIKDGAISKWKLRNKDLVYTKDPRWLNWMQYVRIADQDSHQNLVPLQYKGGLYYRSECHINAGDELLVRWDSDNKESEIQDMEDSYCKPRVCESLDDSYACTFCCVGYKSISHLKAHNCTCIEKRNKKDFCEDIIQCDICNIYLDKKEYSDYHMNRCYKSNGKCVFKSYRKRNHEGSLRYRVHNVDRPFSCTLCPYKATKKWYLKQHIAVHNGDQPFACTLCPYKAMTELILKRHSVVHSGDKPFACTLCPYKTSTKGNLKKHVAIHAEIKTLACTLCPYKAKTKLNLTRHIANHNNDRPFACTLCSYKAATKSILKKHIAIHSDDKSFACTLCPFKTKRKGNLKAHVAIHDGVKPFACTLCPFKTTNNTKLKQHIVIHDDVKPFACTLCPYRTTSTVLLKHHIAVHNNDRPFACTICTYKATTSSNLKQHVALHTGDKPFACTLCPYKGTTKSALKQHVAVHNADKSFLCALCPYKAKTKSNLKVHIAIHNADRPFACTHCPYKTTTKKNLTQHIATHSDDRPFACALCPYKGKTKTNLQQHIAIHNDDNKPVACTLCPYKTTTTLILKQHIAVHHSRRPFACTVCTYKAKTNWNLKQHVVIHNGVKPFACTLCPFRTMGRSKLNEHIAVHKGDKPFACTFCPLRTTRRSNLNKHMAIHNRDKPFRCTLGRFNSTTSSNLKQHVTNHNE